MGQKFRQHALVRRVKMLHEDESHASVWRQGSEKLGAGLQTPGRGANANDRKVLQS